MEGGDLRDDSPTFWSRSNLTDNPIRHDELVRELAEEGYVTDFAKQDEG